MGCIPSKQTVLEGDSPAGPLPRIKPEKARKPKKPKKGLESPIVGEDAAPWVKGHRILSEKDGAIIISERTP